MESKHDPHDPVFIAMIVALLIHTLVYMYWLRQAWKAYDGMNEIARASIDRNQELLKILDRIVGSSVPPPRSKSAERPS